MSDLQTLMAELRAGIDEKENLDALCLAREVANKDLKAKIFRLMQDQGMARDGDKLTMCGLTVTMSEKIRAAYEPDKWDQVVEWAVRTNNLHIVQRRLTDKRVADLVESGVELPDGLRVEPFMELSTRRTG